MTAKQDAQMDQLADTFHIIAIRHESFELGHKLTTTNLSMRLGPSACHCILPLVRLVRLSQTDVVTVSVRPRGGARNTVSGALISAAS